MGMWYLELSKYNFAIGAYWEGEIVAELFSEKLNRISKAIQENPEIIKMYAGAYKHLKEYVEFEFEDETRVSKSYSEISRDFDYQSEEWLKSYLVGLHDGKVEILKSILRFMRYFDGEIVPKINELWYEAKKEEGR